jgi:hypothetical protein
MHIRVRPFSAARALPVNEKQDYFAKASETGA